MPDSRSHRGPHPQDGRRFAAGQIPVLRRGVEDLSWLQSRGYADKSALKLVGDRYSLDTRQRLAVMRSACSDGQLEDRRRRQIPTGDLTGRTVWIDGFNLVITLESALSGAFLFVGRDGCVRDLAGLHGTYRIVSETADAVRLVAEELSRVKAVGALVLLDRPVSNSGRLKGLIESLAAESGWPWEVRLDNNPDNLLLECQHPVISADSVVLDNCGHWVNLAAEIVRKLPDANCLNLGPPYL